MTDVCEKIKVMKPRRQDSDISKEPVLSRCAKDKSPINHARMISLFVVVKYYNEDLETYKDVLALDLKKGKKT